MVTVAKKTTNATWFEIPVENLERATKFYEKVFDVKLSLEEIEDMKLAMFPFIQDAPGASGTLIEGGSYEPSHAGAIVYFSVESIEETLRRINANGGRTLMPKTRIGEHGFVAHFEDSEGNRVALHSVT